MSVSPRYFEHDGNRLAYYEYGEGDQILVYLHGLLADSSMNEGLAESLAERGHRVVLIDLLGHGRSDKPDRASAYRMDTYAAQVIAGMDHLGVERAVIGGVSLGANISLEIASRHPERVRGLLLEMPVLEWATPAAAMIFTPVLLALHYGKSVVKFIGSLADRLPHLPDESLDRQLRSLGTNPESVTAVLHGILVGPVAPTVEQRAAIDVPALVLAHKNDLIHPFSDAVRLAGQLPNGRLVRAHSIAELRLRPERLTAEIVDFLDEVEAADRTAPLAS